VTLPKFNFQHSTAEDHQWKRLINDSNKADETVNLIPATALRWSLDQVDSAHKAGTRSIPHTLRSQAFNVAKFEGDTYHSNDDVSLGKTAPKVRELMDL